MSTRTSGIDIDYYSVLGVATTATPSEIQRAYRSKARLLHPDVNKRPDAAKMFAQLTEAYDALSHPTRRRAYDLSRHAGGPATWGGSGIPPEAGQHQRARQSQRTSPQGEPSLRGPDVRQTVHLSVREAAFGTNKKVTIARREVCQMCKGTGANTGASLQQCPRCHGMGRGYHQEECTRCHGNGALSANPCKTCGGSGRVTGEQEFALHFPPGIEDGEDLRIRNEGDPGPQGGPRGDLHVMVTVEQDPVLMRRGADVYATLVITPEQAATGGRFQVQTLRRLQRVKVPAGVADGATIVMPGQGLRLKNRWRRGDQHVTIQVQG